MPALVAPLCGWCGQHATLDAARTAWVCDRFPCSRTVRPLRASELELVRPAVRPPDRARTLTEALLDVRALVRPAAAASFPWAERALARIDAALAEDGP